MRFFLPAALMYLAAALSACGGGSVPAAPQTPGAAATPSKGRAAAATVCPPDAPTTDSAVEGIPRPLVCGHVPGKFDVQHTTGASFFVDERVGTGAEAQAGKKVTVNYTGYLIDGTVFVDTYTSGQPVTFVVGDGSAIKGLDEGVAGMRVGGRRRLGIPPESAYGAAGGLGGKVPANASLAYDIELMDAQ
jgi:hypothetical protein